MKIMELNTREYEKLVKKGLIEENKKIEKLKDILRVDDLEPPYNCNLQKIWCEVIKQQNKINEIIDFINNLESEVD